MSDSQHYTRTYTEQENPDKSGWYDTNMGKLEWVGWWRDNSEHPCAPQYWYKPVEEAADIKISYHCHLAGCEGNIECNNPTCGRLTKTNENDK